MERFGIYVCEEEDCDFGSLEEEKAVEHAEENPDHEMRGTGITVHRCSLTEEVDVDGDAGE